MRKASVQARRRAAVALRGCVESLERELASLRSETARFSTDIKKVVVHLQNKMGELDTKVEGVRVDGDRLRNEASTVSFNLKKRVDELDAKAASVKRRDDDLYGLLARIKEQLIACKHPAVVLIVSDEIAKKFGTDLEYETKLRVLPSRALSPASFSIGSLSDAASAVLERAGEWDRKQMDNEIHLLAELYFRAVTGQNRPAVRKVMAGVPE